VIRFAALTRLLSSKHHSTSELPLIETMTSRNADPDFLRQAKSIGGAFLLLVSSPSSREQMLY
jgi:hypothetical protein